MNKVYRTVWNQTTNTWVAVQETAKAHGKSSRSSSKNVNTGVSMHFVYATVAIAVMLTSGHAFAITGAGYQQSNGDINCFFHAYSQNVVCGTHTTKAADTYNGKFGKSLAMGLNAQTAGESNVALGANSSATKTAATALGANAKALNDYGVAIGFESVANNTWDISIGRKAGADALAKGDGRNIAIGDGALHKGKNANNNTVLGTSAGDSLNGSHNIVVGAYANSPTANGSAVTANNTIALGERAVASSSSSVAIGTRVKASGAISNAVGASAEASGAYSIANGYGALASGKNAIAIGSAREQIDAKVKATGNNAIAIGSVRTEAGGAGAIAIGEETKASGLNSISLGKYAGQAADNAAVDQLSQTVNIGYRSGFGTKRNIHGIAIGNGAGEGVDSPSGQNIALGNAAGTKVKGNTNVAISARAGQNVEGHDNFAALVDAGQNIKGNNNIAIGKNAGRSADAAKPLEVSDTIALGAQTIANKNGAVALGANSSANRAALKPNAATSNTATAAANQVYALDQASDTDKTAISATVLGSLGAVSVGNATNTRQIINVAAGSEDSDAVNVAQLKAVANMAVASQTHYYSVNTTDKNANSNFNNDGAKGLDSLAAGVRVEASRKNGVAIGSDAIAAGSESLAIGNNVIAGSLKPKANAGDPDVVDPAVDVKGATAVGNNSRATAAGAQAFGQSSLASGVNSAAVGRLAIASGERASAFGVGNTASGASSFAGGDRSVASGANSIAIGLQAQATQDQSIAIGGNASAAQAHGIALGSNSVANIAAGVAGVDPLNAGGPQDNSTWKATHAALSVGNGAAVTRQITSVAAGTQDTDAVNVAQLKTVADHTKTVGDSVKNILGGNAAITPQGNLTMDNIGGTGKGTIHEAIQASKTTVSSNNNSITVVKTTDKTTGADNYDLSVNAQSLAEGAQLPVVYTNANGDKLYKHTDGNFYTQPNGGGVPVPVNDVIASMQNANGNTTTPTTLANVKAGARDTDAVNVSQLKGVTQALGGGAGINPATGAFNAPSYVIAKTDGKVYAAVNDVGSALNNLNTEVVKPLTFAGDSGKNVDRKLGSIVNIKGGAAGTLTDGNIGVVGNGTDTLTIKLAENINLGDKGSVQTGGTTVNNAGVTIANADPDKVVSLSGSGLNNGGNKITGVADGVAPTDAVNMSQLNAVSDKVNAGWNIGNGGTNPIGAVKPGTRVDFVAGNSSTKVEVKQDPANGNHTVTVSAAPGALQYTAGNQPAGNNTPNANQFVPTDSVTLVGAGGKTGNGVTINNVAPAVLSSVSKQAVNGSQLYNTGSSTASALGGTSSFDPSTGKVTAGLNVGGTIHNNVQSALDAINTTAGAGWNLQANGGTVSNIAPSGTVNVTNGSNTKVTLTGNTLKVDVVDAPTFGGQVTANGGITVGGNLTAAAGTDVNMGGNVVHNVADGVAGTDAVNVRQLNAALGGIAGNNNANINALDAKINDVANTANAGVAQAIATAGLPQAYLPGKNMIAVGGGYYKGETGYAIGFSTISDSGNWIIKATGSGNSRGNFGASIGAGYQW